MTERIQRFAVSSVKRTRRGRARTFTRGALAFAIGPVAAALLVPALRSLGIVIPGSLADLWLLSWLVGTPIATALAFAAGRRERLDVNVIEVREDALVLADAARERLVPRRSIEGVLAVESDGEDVEIVLAGGDALHVFLPDPAAAAALIEALGFARRAKRVVIPLGEPLDAVAAGCWGVLLGALASLLTTCTAVAFSWFTSLVSLLGYLIAGAFVLGSIFFARLFTQGRAVVGTDGVLIESAFRRRFFPMAQIEGVEAVRRGYDLRLAPGCSPRRLTLVAGDGPRADAIAARVREALRARREAPSEGAPAVLARGGRSLREWREALRKLVTAGGYRGEAVSPDALLRAVERPDAPLEERLGAAMVVGFSDDDGAKQRLRVVVEGLASEPARAALARAAEGAEDDAAIEEALAAERAAARRRR